MLLLVPPYEEHTGLALGEPSVMWLPSLEGPSVEVRPTHRPCACHALGRRQDAWPDEELSPGATPSADNAWGGLFMSVVYAGISLLEWAAFSENAT